MKICVLQPDYSTTGVDYKAYDPPRDLRALLPGHEVQHVFLNKLTTYRQLRDLGRQGFDIFVNLCEGYLEWEVPGIDVIYTLEQLNLPFTGPTALLYDPPKDLMKYVAYCQGVRTPGYRLIQTEEEAAHLPDSLQYPLFVKPAKAGDSLGVDEFSLVRNRQELVSKSRALFPEYGPLLVEEYIAGREFTVLVTALPDGRDCKAFRPVEYIFPEGPAFKTYALKTSSLHPDANIPCTEEDLDLALRAAATRIFRGFNGVGYARLDFRVNDQREIFFLEINFTCSVFYADGYEGSADYILKYDEAGQQGFLELIIAEGIARHRRRQKPYTRKGDAIAGYGIYANRALGKGELIFAGEGKAQRIITRRYVEQHWSQEEKELFRRYAYPISSEVFVLWDDDPSAWAPQNHNCDPNTVYDGLNVVALRDIPLHEELTLDYGHFLDEHMEPFTCRCGSPSCRGLITGKPGNTISAREKEKISVP